MASDQEDEVEEEMETKYMEEVCPICHTRIDEKGRCACGAGGD